MGGHAVRSQHPTEGDDHNPACAGAAEGDGRTLGPSATDIGVVEQDGATAVHSPLDRRWDLEGACVRPHVAHWCPGADEEARRPAGGGKAGADGAGQPLQPLERRPMGSGRRGNGERELDGTARRRGDAGGVVGQEVVEQLANHRREAVTGLGDGRLLVPHQHGVEGAGQRAQAHGEHGRQREVQAEAHPATGEAHPPARQGRTATDEAHPGSAGWDPVKVRWRERGSGRGPVDARERSRWPG